MMRKYGKRTLISKDESEVSDKEVKKRLYCPLYSDKSQELVREYNYHRDQMRKLEQEYIKHEKRMLELEKEIEVERKYRDK